MTPSIFDDPLTSRELNIALRQLKKGKSPGPDKIHNEMLQNLGSKGLTVVLDLFNRTWKEGCLPKAWKLATITPILKEGKTANNTKIYWPILLTSYLGKFCEWIMSSCPNWLLESSGLISQF